MRILNWLCKMSLNEKLTGTAKVALRILIDQCREDKREIDQRHKKLMDRITELEQVNLKLHRENTDIKQNARAKAQDIAKMIAEQW